VEALTHPDRPRYRWWAQQSPAIDQLESHAAAIDPSIIRLPLSLMHSHPELRRYVAARYPVPIWICGATSRSPRVRGRHGGWWRCSRARSGRPRP
jgi:hypothetical protein